MSLALLLVPMATALSAFFLYLFLRANAEGQFDDLETPALRMLDDGPAGPAEPRIPTSEKH